MKLKFKIETSIPDLIVKTILISLAFGVVGIGIAGATIPVGFGFLVEYYHIVVSIVLFIIVIKNIINSITIETYGSLKIDTSESEIQKEFENERKK